MQIQMAYTFLLWCKFGPLHLGFSVHVLGELIIHSLSRSAEPSYRASDIPDFASILVLHKIIHCGINLRGWAKF